MTKRAQAILFFALTASASAARLPPVSASEFSRRIWRIEDGLPQNRILALSQTADGYLWIGTSEGLVRFDGARFTIFDQSNTPALTDDSILALALGRDGALWIGTEGGGLGRYEHGAFSGFGAKEGLTNGFVRSIHEDRNGILWVGTDRGFFRRDGTRFTRLDGTPEIPLATVGSIGEDDAGHIWAASPMGLLAVSGGKLAHVPSACPPLVTRTYFAPGRESLWAFGPSGASRFRNGCLIPEAGLPLVPMKSMAEDEAGSLWIGTIGSGVIRFHNGRATSLTTESGLPGNTANALLLDRERNLWIGSEDGLVRLTRRSGTNIGSLEGMDDDDVATVYPDRRNNLWITTLAGQVYKATDGRATRYRLPPPAENLRIRNVLEDRTGAFWFGTARSGLVVQRGNNVTIYGHEAGLRSNSVRQIIEDASGALWIALSSGLSRWDGHSFRNYYLEDGLSYPSTRCMLIDARGDILVGTDAGLNRIHNGDIVRDQEFAALAREKIWAIHQDRDGTLWLGTHGRGLLRFRAGAISRFSRENGLPGNTIYQILPGGEGTMWISTSSGVISLDSKELEDAANGNDRIVHVVSYGAADGMSTSQMNGGIQPAGARTASGEIWFASVKGAIRIQPSTAPSRTAGAATIERIVADNRSFPATGTVTVPPGHGRLEFDFTFCDLANPQRVGFLYKLEAFDENWTAAMRTRSATYTNVPPGHYRFLVKASEASIAGFSEASVSVVLLPAFYQTNWFIALLVLAAVGAVWASVAIYARQTRMRFNLLLAERTRLAREMHDTVIQGCVGVATLLEASAGFRNEDAREADRYVDQARFQVMTTLEEARQAVWDLRHNTADESCIDMLLDLARRLGEEHGIRIETQIAGDAPLDPESDRTMLLVGREALRNAVAHSSARFISLSIRRNPSEVCLEVNDDGSGFSVGGNGNGDKRHFGVIGMRERVEGLGGKFSIVSNANAGTRITARVPLSRQASG